METHAEQNPVRSGLSLVNRGWNQNNQKNDIARNVARPHPGFDDRLAHNDQSDGHGKHDQGASAVSGNEYLTEPDEVSSRMKVAGHGSEDLCQAAYGFPGVIY